MKEMLIDYGFSIFFLFLVPGILMMIGTTLYLNHSKRRSRLFELGYSKQSKWYQGEKVDFFTANYLISYMVTVAWMMKHRWGFNYEKGMRYGNAIAPNLHIDKNYEKLFEEFPFFVRWEIVKKGFLFISVLGMIIGAGATEGWFF